MDLRKITTLIQSLLLPQPSVQLAADGDVTVLLATARERILTSLLRPAAFLGTVTIIYVSKDLIQFGGLGILSFYIACMAVVWTMAIFRHLSYALRASVFCAILFTLGVFDLLLYGISEDWRLYFACFSIVTLLFGGKRAGVLATILSVVTFFTIGWMRSNGLWTINQSVLPLGEPLLNAIFIYSITFTTTVGLTVIALSNLLNEFERALANERKSATLLLHERDSLESRVLARTHELQERNVELAASQQKAQAANESKSRFLSHISHELRTPMNGVIGMTSLLLKTNLDREQSDIVNTIRHSGDTMLTLINELLDLSKIEANKIELEAVPFDLATCIEESFELVSPILAEKDLNLVYLISPGIPDRWIQDVTRIRQILTNLVSNAVKFTERGEVVVSVEAVPIHNDQFMLSFSVKDTGIGIADEMQERLFQPFSQAELSTRRRYGGTGLGLAISKQLCQLMGGDITVQSKLGVGSVFHFSVLARPAPDQLQAEAQALSALAGKQLVLIESHQLNSRMLARHFQEWKVEAITVPMETPIKDVLVNCQNADALLFDWQPSNGVGLQLLTAIQKRYPALPIVVLAARSSHMLDHQSSKKFLIVPKPIRPLVVKTALESLVGSQTQPSIAPTPAVDTQLELNQRTRLRILVAEDNVVNQKVMIGILKRNGYQADIVANGIEVLQAVSRQAYDVILMDINMPEMDGLTATQRIREQLPSFRQPYIIAITANAMEDAREEYLQAGMNDYISKPINIDKLLAALLRAQNGENQANHTPTISLPVIYYETPIRPPVIQTSQSLVY